jgi:PAS domain S-box-containing protein
MKVKHSYSTDSDALRLKAEEKLREKLPEVGNLHKEADILKMIHELQVHQIELEMQNDELEKAKMEAYDAVQLYDLAPTGYFTLSSNGEILKLNISGAQMLGKERLHLRNSRFGFFVSDASKPVFNLFLEKIFKSETKETCEIALSINDDSAVFLHLSGIMNGNVGQCFVTAVDITEHKQMEETIKSNSIKLEIAMQAAKMAWWEMDLRTGNVTFEKRKADMLGFPPEKFKTYTDFTNLLHPQDYEKAMNAMRFHLNGEIDKYEVEYRILSRSGEYKWFYDIGAIVNRDSHGKPLSVAGLVFDIDQRKNAEEALKESEIQYRELVENSPDAILIYVDGKIAMVNRECLHLMALTNDEDLIGKPVVQFVHPDYRQLVLGRMEKAVNEGAILPLVEEKFIRPDGSDVDVEVKAMSIKLGSKHAVQLIVRDITERKQTEEALRLSEKQYRDMFYKNTAVKLIVDPSNGAILNANNAAAKFYGYSLNSLEKMNINQINTLGSEQLKSEMALALSERRKYFDFRHRLSTGEIRDVEVYSGPIEFGGSTRLYSIVQDVTDRKLAQKSLRDLNWRLESLVESTHIGTWEWNVQTGEAVFNEVWANIIGYTLLELTPVSIKTWEMLTHPEDYVFCIDLLNKHFAGELPYYDNDFRMKHKNGQWVWIHDRGRVVTRTQDGKPLMMFGTHSDITGRKQVEETLRMNEENLRKINAEKDKFFSIIAHDLRSPFNGFLGLTEIMVDGLAGMTMDEIQKIALLLRKSATNLYSLLSNLLEWSRMQRGLTSFVPSSFLLMPKISENIALVKDAADKKEILISYAVAQDLYVYADENMLGGVLRNLLNNAVKFTAKGGIIMISAKIKSDQFVEISVRDTGIGMNKNLLDNLFHLDVNTSRKGTDGESSTGLGLMISNDFIEKNGGKLSIESHEGVGSVFYFTVPVHGESEENAV